MISRLEQLEVKEFTIEEEYFTPDADLTKIALKFKSKKIIDINETGNFVIIKLTLTSFFFKDPIGALYHGRPRRDIRRNSF